MMNGRECKQLIDPKKAELFTGSLGKLKETQRAEPVAMVSAEGEVTHWFVPFIQEERALGFAIVSQAGKFVSYGLLSPRPSSKPGIDRHFFTEPPAGILEEIKERFPGMHLVSQAFSYDQSPQRWGWRVTIEQGKQAMVLFATPGGWYQTAAPKPGWEGA